MKQKNGAQSGAAKALLGMVENTMSKWISTTSNPGPLIRSLAGNKLATERYAYDALAASPAVKLLE
ncbi:hypothetical protein [Nocardia xishanensis]|uniref:hypothetical protein n=1 Tax=Nocardia xishanensis TaxID=238964 RepID=UPI0033D499F1